MKVSDPKWHRRFLRIAGEVALWSKDPSTKVGAVIVSPDGLIISTGYNGIPRGADDRPERMERPGKYLWLSHSEASAIANAARHGSKTDGATIFVTHQPCCDCAKLIINAGIATVVCDTGTTSMKPEAFAVARTMFREAGVKLVCDEG